MYTLNLSVLPTLGKTSWPVRQKNSAAENKFWSPNKFDFLKLDICMFKFGRLKTVEERKITGSYGRRRAVNPVLINVWELETSEGFPKQPNSATDLRALL